MKIIKKLKKGYTLAEMLIAMVLMGTIACLLTPVLLVAPSQSVFVKEYRRAYEEIDTATTSLVKSHGYTLNGACGVMDNPHNCLKDLYAGFFEPTLRVCNDGTTFGNCWHKPSEYHRMDGQEIAFPNTSGFITKDGVLVYFISYEPYCSTKIDWAKGIEPCGIVMLDVNGFSKPNKIGRDIYSIWILKDRLLPFGTAIDGFDGDKKTTGWGYSTSSL